MKKQINELRSGVILSYINLGIGSLIPFLYTPIMLRILGQEEYGLYSLSSSAVSYLSLLSFGFGSTIIRYIAKYRAENDKESLESTYGFFLLLYGVLGILVFLGGLTISVNVEGIFHKGLQDYEIIKMRTLVMLMAFNVAISFPISVFSSVITSHEKYIFKKIIDILATVIAPIANLIALYLGFASIGMVIATTITQFLLLPLNVRYCYKVLCLRPKFRKMPKFLVKEMLGFSVFVFIASIVDMLFWATDKVILGMLASTTAVAIYNVGGTFNSMVMNLSTSISGVLTPKITGMVVKEVEQKELTELFIKIGRLQFIIIALVVSGFTVFGQVFIRLWAGTEYGASYWIAVLTMFPLCIPLIQNTGLGIITAQNKHQFRAVVYLIIAILNVISTYLVVPTMGIIGAALCSCIAYLIGQGLIMNIYYYKVTGIDIPLFWRNILRMAVVPGVMLVLGLLMNNIVVVENWIQFLLRVICYTVVYVIVMYGLVMNEYEKDIFRKPLIKILFLKK